MKKKTVRTLVFAALFTALEVVLSRFCSVNTQGWKIGFSFVPVVACAALFGPLVSASVCAASDLIGALLFPIGPYFPGFTLCSGIMGAVWGLFLYKKGETSALNGSRTRNFMKILSPTLINNIAVGLIVNTVWVSILYGSKTYFGWFLYRLPEYAIKIPVELVLVPIIVKLCVKLKNKYKI